MENRPNRPRRVTDFEREGAKETRLAPDQTPLPEELPEAKPDPSWSALGTTRVLTPSGDEDGGLVSRSLDGVIKNDTQSVLGEFVLEKKLGEGAMGAVFKARQPSFENRIVALKVLFPHVANNQKLVQRLRREAEAMFDLDHPNIVASFGVGDDQGWHFVAMEFVDGDSVQKWLNRLGRLSVADAIHITIACARALEYAHAQGHIHRDIKPDNILITRTGRVKVTDLGMVKKLDEDEEKGLTMTGHAVGTPWYMPLEQARNAKDADCRCDIYSLGCMLYCMLTGNPPFTGQTIVEVIQAKEKGSFAPARSANPDIPERLDLIIAKMAHKQAKHRYQTCTEVIRDLEELGLASKKLEFLGQKAPTQQPVTPPASRSMIATMVTTVNEDWYVKLRAEQETGVKMTTSQIKDLIRLGKLKASAQISRTPKEGYRILTAYKEFEAAASQRRSQRSFGTSKQMKTLSEKIDAAERKREEDSKPVEVTSFHYWMQIFWQCAAVVGVVGFVLYGIYWAVTAIFR